jgi:hypothetical protein
MNGLSRALVRSMLTAPEAAASMRAFLNERVANLSRAMSGNNADLRAALIVRKSPPTGHESARNRHIRQRADTAWLRRLVLRRAWRDIRATCSALDDESFEPWVLTTTDIWRRRRASRR